MANQMQTPPSWVDGDVLYAATLTTGFSNITTYANSYMAWLGANQTFAGNNTFSGTTTLSGTVTISGTPTVSTNTLTLSPQNALTFGHATARIIPGGTSLTIRDSTNTNDNATFNNVGALTLRSALTVSTNGITVTAGGLTVSSGTTAVQALTATTISPSTSYNFGSSTGKIILPATAIQIRNNGDTKSLISFADQSIGTGDSSYLVDFSVHGSGARSATDTKGFLVLSEVGGSMTYTVGQSNCAVIYDSLNHKIGVQYGGAWRYTAALT